MANIDLLKPKIKKMAMELINACNAVGIKIIITQTLRTIAEQDALYAQGRTKPGKIVTNAKGGTSFHNFGVALDFCPVIDGKAVWNDLSLFEKVGSIGAGLGFEWGGNWKDFKDRPHLQFTAGYSLKEFMDNKIDWSKFN